MWPYSRWTGLLRLLYVHNPFYVISAGLMLYGLYIAFRGDPAALAHPERLALALGGYTPSWR